MDKKETTRLLDSLIKYNRVDINNMRGQFPELGNAFMNVILAIDQEYGSGNIDRNLLKTPAPSVNAKKLTFEEFGQQFVGKFVYYDYSKTWIYFLELNIFEERNDNYYFKVISSNSTNGKEKIEQYTKDTLKRFLNGSSGWKFINVKVGDKVKIPKTKEGNANDVKTDNGVVRANSLNQDFLYFNKFDPKTGKAQLFWKQIDSGNFYDINEVEPYEANQPSYKIGDVYGSDRWLDKAFIKITGIDNNNVIVLDDEGIESIYTKEKFEEDLNNGYYIKRNTNANQLPFKVGDYITSPNWNKTSWVKITNLDMPYGTGVDEKGVTWVREIVDIIDGFNNGVLIKIPDPTISQLSYKVGDRFYLSLTPTIIFTIKEISIPKSAVTIEDENGNENRRKLDYVINSFKKREYILLPYKEGDYFKGKSFTTDVEWIKIREILKDEIIGIRNDGSEYKINIKDFNKYIDNGEFYIIPDPTVKQTLFKLGDTFKIKDYPADDYLIDNIDLNQSRVDIKNLKTNYVTKVPYAQVEDDFKNGEYILLPPTTVSNAPTQTFTLTKWTKDWKANGLRPSPTRKASLEKLDALGVGNDGIVYEVGQDKNGTKKWKKTGFTLYNPDVRKEFTSKYDLQLLYDQIVYENSQLDPMDIDYNENEKLIIKIMEELKTK